MNRLIGTTARGIRTPIVKQGDDLVNIVVDSLLSAVTSESIVLKDKDVIGITESLVARAQGNYASVDSIGKDVANKFPGEIGVVFPILSRNRFSIVLKGIAKSNRKIHLLLSYPSDEVGNHLMDIDKMDELKINPYSDVLTEEDYRRLFGKNVMHPFTDIDYVQMYRDIIGENVSIYFANDPRTILNYTKDVLVANIHDRVRTKRLIHDAGANIVLGLDDILTTSVDGSGYNDEYGLLGSNLSSDDEVKLFPRNSNYYVNEIQKILLDKTGKKIEVMVYGDGAFKDPVGKIWELADPIVSPGYTDGLIGLPNELKFKYVADNELQDLDGEEAIAAMKNRISSKEANLTGQAASLGTTPRRITDLLGSLCDLISGSGDKGTPVILIQGYFDNYATE
ncbi:coenzyme F420-0:L-glutamate ligase [Tissierella sp. Yu-01]|uniref:coenzyme F420-0:L-glutamate ligase n=1 Tax=Tissierella sp. Yu-01 TaxID=3035694 RepID=UPI00240E883C|nr:coenzyme F420-0:L-glutamate ligase [Tissierella sp. Yu-01]WFA09140.1 coenzyme F420-0:L-glutamate ligase [Tissierella sp. Yu-01]